jgi:hypothetical protein
MSTSHFSWGAILTLGDGLVGGNPDLTHVGGGMRHERQLNFGGIEGVLFLKSPPTAYIC